MRENNRKPIEKCRKKLPQFTTMNVIDGQAGLVIYSSLIFYSLTIDNILNIIVLLILAGVTIAALSGPNGILTNATKAREDNAKAQVIEEARVDILAKQTEKRGETLTDNELESILTPKYGTLSDEENILDRTLTTENGYKIPVSDIYNGELSESVSIPEGLEIGSEVKYNPSVTYDWLSKYCSSSNDSNYQKTLNSGTGQNFNINTWRVFEIDEETGEVKLVPAHSTDDRAEGPTSGTVNLQGAQGYNNAVYLLNKACSELYGDSSRGITARSINIEDIEGKMTDAAIAEVHSIESGYEQQVSAPYSRDNSYYPSIYANERLSVINGKENSSGIGMSVQDNLVKPTDGNETDGDATEGHIQATTNIQPKKTYWYKDNTFMKTAFETANNGVKYYDLLMPDDTNTFYWVASRCVNANLSLCNFSVRAVGFGEVNAYGMFDSRDSGGNGFFGIFPVVSLSSKLITGDTIDGFSVE